MRISISTQLIISFLENVHFLGRTFTLDWHTKFYKSSTELRDILQSLAEQICESSVTIKSIFFDSLVKGTNIWCEVYCLLKTYLQNLIEIELEYPINFKQMKYLKGAVEESTQDEEYRDLFVSMVYYCSS